MPPHPMGGPGFTWQDFVYALMTEGYVRSPHLRDNPGLSVHRAQVRS